MHDLLQRITFDKDVLCGKPVGRRLRISVEMILELMVNGASGDEILEDYPELEPADLQATLLYAHHVVADETILDRVAVRWARSAIPVSTADSATNSSSASQANSVSSAEKSPSSSSTKVMVTA